MDKLSVSTYCGSGSIETQTSGRIAVDNWWTLVDTVTRKSRLESRHSATSPATAPEGNCGETGSDLLLLLFGFRKVA